MPRGVIDITVLGDREIERALTRLPEREAPKIVRRAFRDSAKRLRPKIAAATPVDTGRLKRGMAAAKVRSAARKRGEIKVGVVMPTREELGIPPGATAYYPYVLEYGSATLGRPPLRFVRGTVDANRESEWRQIGRDIGRHMEAYWRKATKR